MIAENSADTAEKYLPALLSADDRAILALFAVEPSIHDPIDGHISGTARVPEFVQERARWFAQRAARIEHLRTTRDSFISVVEYTVHLSLNGEPYPLPYAVVGQRAGGNRLHELRVYHSLWPLIGAHEVRPAILSAGHDFQLNGAVAKYQKALAEGDVAAILETFEPDGYFREPAGGPHVHRGPAELAEFMGQILSKGGITLEHCTIIDDGVACAIEFNAVAFGNQKLIPQAGVAVYGRGPSGLLRAARVYDDTNVEALIE